MKKTRFLTMLLNLIVPLSFGSTVSKFPLAFSIAHPSEKKLLQEVVKGQVLDGNEKPIPGVTVSLRGTGTVVATDIEGHFVLEKVPVGAVLVFKSIGYKQQEVPLLEKKILRVVMEDDVAGLDEVIVVGYGVAKKK